MLDEPVRVHRDDLGVPTLVGSSDRDLMRALGFVHAQDRFFQMDVWRHTARGRTAEMFGEQGLSNDRFLRTLGWERIAEAELRLLDPTTRRALADYTAGVNAYLQRRSPAELSLEYAVLGLTQPGYEPRPWEPTDTLAFLKLMAWDLRSNLDEEIERAVLAQELGPQRTAELYPPYDDAPAIAQRWGSPGGSGDPLADVDWDVATPLLKRLGDRVAEVPGLSPPGSDGLGSNSWVVAGEHTASGAPLLANDPHLGIQMPSIWHQGALRCAPDAAESECSLDVAGFTFPGVPGIVVGHNANIAWGVTNTGADVMDLYVERIHPEDPTRYRAEGQWLDMEVTTETLRSAGGATEELTVRRTRNGPIISDVYGPVGGVDPAEVPGGEPGARYAISLRWTALEPRPALDTLPALNRAGGWRDFREALSSFFVPGQNFVYADTDGSIGYQATGVVPRRPAGTGLVPAPGWQSAHQWDGHVPYDELPRVHDPERGWIVTANNPLAGRDYPYWLGADWAYGQRARRLTELLRGAEGSLTPADVRRQQADTRHPAADWLVPALSAAVDGIAGDDAGDPAGAAQIVPALEGWDHRMDADSAGAAAFAATWRELLAGMFHELPADHRPSGGDRWFAVVQRLMTRPDAGWWDMAGTDAVERRDAALAVAADRAAAELGGDPGEDPGAWRWGELHTATFENQTIGRSGIGVIESRFNRGPHPASGSSSIVNATAWDAARGYEVTSLPSLRMIVDLGDLGRSRGIHAPGQSGHAYHPDYTSMIQPWLDGEQHPLAWRVDDAEARSERTLELRPATPAR